MKKNHFFVTILLLCLASLPQISLASSGCKCDPCKCDPCNCQPNKTAYCKCDPCRCDPCKCGPNKSADCRCETCKCNPCDCSGEKRQGLFTMQACPQNDKYFQGYVQALIDMNYYEYRVTVTVQDRIVYLYNLPKNSALCSSIVQFVESIPGVDCLKLECPPHEEEEACENEQAALYPPGRVSGIWMPQQTVLFAPLLADLRQSMYSGAYRWGDRVMGKHAGAVSFGEDFPIYRWRNIGSHSMDVQIGIEGCVFAVFDISHSNTILMNADYYVGIPVTWAYDNWSWRFRIYHISSHLGDEYMVEHPDVVRLNASREAVDIFVSYQYHTWMRPYLGFGWNIHYDPCFPIEGPYVQYGVEFRFLGRRDCFNSLYMQPFLAFNVQNAHFHNWEFDASSSLGIEWSKIQGVGRKMRISVDGHAGFCPDGQFCKEKTAWVQIKLAYGF